MSISDADRIGLPPRPFLYTIDQIATILSMPERTLHVTYIHHEGRDVGVRASHTMVARNIAPPDDKPDWRVAEKELIRWMKSRGFKYYSQGTVTR